jgi:hypothetical protein
VHVPTPYIWWSSTDGDGGVGRAPECDDDALSVAFTFPNELDGTFSGSVRYELRIDLDDRGQSYVRPEISRIRGGIPSQPVLDRLLDIACRAVGWGSLPVRWWRDPQDDPVEYARWFRERHDPELRQAADAHQTAVQRVNR